MESLSRAISSLNREIKVKFIVRILIAGLSTVILALSLCFPGRDISIAAMGCATMLAVYGAVVGRGNWLLVIPFVFLSYCSYSILCGVYLGLVEQSPYLAFAGTDYAWTGASVMLAFTMGITFFLPMQVRHFPNIRISSPCFNGIIVTICVVGIIAASFGLNEMTGSRMAISSFYEYSIIFVIIGFYYAADNKWAIAIVILAVVFRLFLDLITGNRVTSLEMLVALFVMGVSYRTKGTKLIIPCVILYFALMAVGSLRGSEFSLDMIMQDFADMFFSSWGAWDGAYSAYHTSMSILATEQFYPASERLMQFPAYVLSISISPIDLVSSPTELARQIFWHMGGTYFPFFAHFYLGFPGVIIISCFLGLLLRWLARIDLKAKEMSVFGLIVIWVVSTSFRWIQYEPTHLMRGIILMGVVALIAHLFASVCKDKRDYGRIGFVKCTKGRSALRMQEAEIKDSRPDGV